MCEAGEGMSARALFVLNREARIRFSRAYPDFLSPGVDDLLTTLEALASETIGDQRSDERSLRIELHGVNLIS